MLELYNDRLIDLLAENSNGDVSLYIYHNIYYHNFGDAFACAFVSFVNLRVLLTVIHR